MSFCLFVYSFSSLAFVPFPSRGNSIGRGSPLFLMSPHYVHLPPSLELQHLPYLSISLYSLRDILVRIPIRGSVPLPYGSWCTFTSVFIHNHHKKSKIKSRNSRNQGFANFFCLLVEESGSGRPKNIRIRIYNTDSLCVEGILYEHKEHPYSFFKWIHLLMFFFHDLTLCWCFFLCCSICQILPR